MRQMDFLAELTLSLDMEPEVVRAVWETALNLLQAKLIEGEPVNTTIGRFFPSLFLGDGVARQNGEGPLVRAADRSRDRVVPTFEWDERVRRFITDNAPVEGPVGEKIRRQSEIKTKNFRRSQAYKKRVFSKG